MEPDSWFLQELRRNGVYFSFSSPTGRRRRLGGDVGPSSVTAACCCRIFWILLGSLTCVSVLGFLETLAERAPSRLSVIRNLERHEVDKPIGLLLCWTHGAVWLRPCRPSLCQLLFKPRAVCRSVNLEQFGELGQ